MPDLITIDEILGRIDTLAGRVDLLEGKAAAAPAPRAVSSPGVFEAFPKIARLSRECVITEKIDGTNAQIYITENGAIHAGSRTRWIQATKGQDNYGFAQWAEDNRDDLAKLGPGHHFGEWWGSGIRRNYGLKEKRFSLFNVSIWADPCLRPACCSVVPTLYRGLFDTAAILQTLADLASTGSAAVPGFMDPEGIVIFHAASGQLFKKTIKGDEQPKSAATR